MNLLKTTLTSSKLEEIGQTLYLLGKSTMLCGVIGIALTVLMGIVSLATGASFFDPMIFNIASSYAFAYPFVIIAYLAIACGIIGVPLYLSGLQLFGLGRIAVNTEKKAIDNNKENNPLKILADKVDEERKKQLANKPLAANEWKCSCGEIHLNYVTSCYCGKTRREVLAEGNNKQSF